jgi:3-deoxy-D-manno-octulosonate 8-phosphate phosphatase (KDO 8-P phosphatase)
MTEGEGRRPRALSQDEIERRARKIRLFAMDVDGVLTDGSIVIMDSGEEVKGWHVRDRIGFFMLKRTTARFHTAWITGRISNQVKVRAEELKIDAVHLKCEDKGRALQDVVKQLGVTLEETLFIGDDLVDLPAFRLAGLAVCPADAPEVVREACHMTTRMPGGRGVFREIVELVLKAQGQWDGVIARFENPSGEAVG